VAAACRSYASHSAALEAVNAALAAGIDGSGVLVVTGESPRDGRGSPLGAFAGNAPRAADVPLGGFAGAPHRYDAGMGAFAGGVQRGGSFADADREVVTTYPEGVERMHVAGHRRIAKLLRDAGLDAEAAARDLDALHCGRVVVLVDAADESDAARVGALLDRVGR
jgi:hypothetical protein